MSKFRIAFTRHLRSNANTYFLLMLALIIGISAGAFTVNGLSSIQRDELVNYFNGFLQLLDTQNIDGGEMFKISLAENLKIVAALWVLGVTIIGIPFIFIIIGIRGFIVGFSSGFIVQTLGLKGILFILFALMPKEIIILPGLIAIGVNGIKFSMNIIKSKSIKHLSKESLKTDFLSYCIVTVFFSCFIMGGILMESYVTPVFIRMIAPGISN